MSTLALPVENYFKQELVQPAAANKTPVPPRLAPLSSVSVTDFSAYQFSKSTPELVVTKRPDMPALAKDDTVTRNFVRPFSVALPQFQVKSPDIKTQVAKIAQEPEEVDAFAEGRPLRKLKSLLKLPKLQKSFLTSQLSPKSVRFASRLENVKMFDGRDSPSAVSTNNTPLGSPLFELDLDDYFGTCNFTDLGLSYDSDTDSSDSDTFYEYTKDKQYQISTSNFTPPRNIYDKLQSPVYLQHVSIGPGKQLLVLLVMCQNLAFEKNLSVKLTFNNWQSNLTINNFSHVKSFLLVNFDQFKFIIPLSRLPSAINAQFCIQYSVNGQDYWDNNGNKNYNITLSSHTPPPKASPLFKPSVSKSSAPSFVPKSSVPSFSPKFSAPSFTPQTQPASNAFAPSSAHKPTSTVPYNYNELISKLMSVKATEDEEPPQLHHLASLPSLRPRFSQSYKAKTAGDSNTKSGGASNTKAGGASNTKGDSSRLKPAGAESSPLRNSVTKNYTLQPETGRSFLDSKESFQDAKFNSTSYAALLQTYCFNSGPASSTTSPVPMSLSNLLSNSSTSINTLDFMTPALAFHSLSDSIHI